MSERVSSELELDLSHLGRQVMGDAALEEEVLSLFCRQHAAFKLVFASVDDEVRRDMAHRLKGSARAIGAFALAAAAEIIETAPRDDQALETLEKRLQRALALIDRRIHFLHGNAPSPGTDG